MEQIDWPGIQANAVHMGIRPAARAAAVNLTPEEQNRFVKRVLKRAEREGWEDRRLAAMSSAGVPVVSRPSTQAKPMSSSVVNGADSASIAIADDERESRLSLSRTVRRLSARAETADIPIESTADLHSLAKTYAVTHRIGEQDGKPAVALVLNVGFLLDHQEQSVEPKLIDVEPA